MPGLVSKDSWSRCEPPSMLYDTIRNPRAPYIVPKRPIVQTDTIESTQQRLNREMLKRLQTHGLQLSHESFVVVVQVGKYMFLAIMLPPYLCLYGLPRWLLLNMIPLVYVFIKNESFRMGRFVIEIQKQIIDLMKGLMQQLIGDALKTSKERSRNLWRHLTAGVQSMVQLFLRGTDQLSAWNSAIKRSLAEFSQVILVKVNRTLQLSREWVLTQWSAFAKKTSEKLQQFDQAVITPFFQWIFDPFIRLGNKVAEMTSKAAKIIEKRKEALKRKIDPIASAVKETLRQIKTAAEKIAHPVVAWLEEKREEIRDLALRSWKKTVDPLVEAAASVRAKIEGRLAATVDLAKYMLQMTPAVLLQSINWMWGLVPQVRKERLGRWGEMAKRGGRLSKNLGRGVVAGLKEVIAAGRRAVGRAQGWLSWLKTLLLRGIRCAVDCLMALPQKVMKGAFVMWRGIKELIHRTVFGCRIFIALLWIACRYGVQLVQRTGNDMIGIISTEKNKI